MDWNVMVQYLPQYEKAAWLTLRSGCRRYLLGHRHAGLVCAVLQYEKVPVLRRIVGAYIQLSRNTPLLVQLFFLYYGLPEGRHQDQRRALRHCRPCLSGRQLHGRGLPQRAGSHRTHPDRKRPAALA